MALAIVEAALNYVTPDGQRIRVFAFDNGGRAHTTTLGSEDAPPVIQSFVRELLKFNAVLRTFQERDDQRAIELAMQGQDDLGSLTLIESLKQELELGVDSSNSSESPHMVEMRTICNSVNRMAIGEWRPSQSPKAHICAHIEEKRQGQPYVSRMRHHF